MKQQTITDTRKKLIATVAGSHNDLQRADNVATEIERRAGMLQIKLNRKLPQLRRAAEKEMLSGDRNASSYGRRQRKYLRAIQNLSRAEKTYQIARRQRVMAERMQ